ncbi:beta-mannosidase, partial [gut metagenome]
DERDIETIVSLLARNTKLPLDEDKIRYLSQAVQSCAMSSAIMGWRALMPYTMGTLFSSLNDTWPEISNSTIDYSGKWKVAHYASRRFFASLAPLIFVENDKLMVYVANDSAKDEEVELKLKLRYFNGKKKESQVYNVFVPSMTSVKVREID